MLLVPPSMFTLLISGARCDLFIFSLSSFSSVFLLLILGPCNRKQDIGEGKGKDCDRRVSCGGWRKLSNWMLYIAVVTAAADRVYWWSESLNLVTHWGRSFLSGEREQNLLRWSESDLSVDREWEGMTACIYMCCYAVNFTFYSRLNKVINSRTKSAEILRFVVRFVVAKVPEVRSAFVFLFRHSQEPRIPFWLLGR
jgi:hypothetical protein